MLVQTFLMSWGISQLTISTHQVARSPWFGRWLLLEPRGLDKVFGMVAPDDYSTFNRFIESSLSSRITKEREGGETNLNLANVRKNILHHLFHAKDPENGGSGYTMAELFEETILLVVAGSDTNSTVVPAMFFYLVRNPEIYRKLTKEIRTRFENVDEIYAGP